MGVASSDIDGSYSEIITYPILDQEVFGYSHWFRSGALGSPGLLVLSRHPILEVSQANSNAACSALVSSKAKVAY